MNTQTIPGQITRISEVCNSICIALGLEKTSIEAPLHRYPDFRRNESVLVVVEVANGRKPRLINLIHKPQLNS